MACNFIKKETLTQVFSCEFCKIFKNTFFTERLRTTASADYLWVKNYDLPNWKQVSQSVAMSWCAVINCNNKIIVKCLISDYPKIQAFIKIGFMLQAVQLIICHLKSWYIQTILKRSALIPAGNFKMNCTIKTVKSVDGFSRDQYQLYYLIKRIINLVYLQRREHWHKERKR